MAALRTRRFERADEAALNDSYLSMARGRWPHMTRSLDLMRWVWYEAPGGPVDSWLVEAQNPDGSWRIVGHHALCPVRFTCGRQDLLCGETTNSFLLPEFRARFLYVRFEQQCLAEVSSRYAMTYTRALGTLRLRAPLGYEAVDRWIELEHGSRYGDLVTRLFARVVQKWPATPWRQLAGLWARADGRLARKASFEWIEYAASDALRATFFEDFWAEARAGAGLSPRRDVADLAWRFWQRPDASVVTLVHKWPAGGGAYCIVNTALPYQFRLVDFFVTPMRPELLEAVLDALFAWCARRGALTISLGTATAGQPPDLMSVLRRRMRPHPLARFREPSQISCRVSPLGQAAGLVGPRWNATELMTVA